MLPNRFLSEKGRLSKEPKSHCAFGLLLKQNISPRTLENRPIWSHWLWRCSSESQSCFSFLLAKCHQTIMEWKQTEQSQSNKFYGQTMRLFTWNTQDLGASSQSANRLGKRLEVAGWVITHKLLGYHKLTNHWNYWIVGNGTAAREK